MIDPWPNPVAVNRDGSVKCCTSKLPVGSWPTPSRPTPGEEAQVDYGTGPLVRDSQSGKYRRTRLFVLTRDGRRRIAAALRRHGWTVNPEKVHRRIREDNLLSVRKRKFIVNTDSNFGRRV